MSAGRETELKFDVPSGSVDKLKKDGLLRRMVNRRDEAVSVYFDTKKLTLRKNGVSLRVRHINGRYVQTVKTGGRSPRAAAFDRDEWEQEIESEALDLDAARGTALAPLLTRKVRRSLEPLFETSMERSVYPIARAGSQIEVSLDQGHIEAAGKFIPLCELELELKQGEACDLFGLAREVAERNPITLGVKSKAERGYELVAGEKPHPLKAISVNLTPKTSLREAFKTIAYACLRQLMANLPCIRAGDSEGLHQARVSLRRLRSAISLFSKSLFSKSLRDAQTEAIKKELKWLTEEFGPARETDVFLNGVVVPFAGRGGEDRGLHLLKEDLVGQHKAAFTRAQKAIGTARFRLLALDIAAWIECGEGSKEARGPAGAVGNRPIRSLARKELRRRRKKLLKRAKRFRELGPAKRHKLRIAAKKLRYASEFFADVFPGTKTERRRCRFVKVLKRLQQVLGQLNDIVAHERLGRELIDRPADGRPQSNTIRSFAAGRLLGREEARCEPLLQAAEKPFAALANAKPYWT